MLRMDAADLGGRANRRLSQDRKAFLAALRQGRPIVRTSVGLRMRGERTVFHPQLGREAVTWGIATLSETAPPVYRATEALRP